jgi:hypothetical protein
MFSISFVSVESMLAIRLSDMRAIAFCALGVKLSCSVISDINPVVKD